MFPKLEIESRREKFEMNYFYVCHTLAINHITCRKNNYATRSNILKSLFCGNSIVFQLTFDQTKIKWIQQCKVATLRDIKDLRDKEEEKNSKRKKDKIGFIPRGIEMVARW